MMRALLVSDVYFPRVNGVSTSIRTFRQDLAACGVEVVGREAHAFAPNGVNDDYLATKAERFGHLLD